MINILEGNCLELMKKIEDKSIDMILSDLPYSTKARKTTWNNWDCEVDLELLWKEYNRIIKKNGAIVLFAQDLFTAKLIMSNSKNYKYKWTWEKESGTGFLNAKRMPLKNTEDILVFYEKQCTYNPQMRIGKPYTTRKGTLSSNYCKTDKIIKTVNEGNRYPLTTVKFNRDKEKLHPTQKPVQLLEYLIKTYTNEGDIVLDSCMGSGSTGIACINTNRNFIGMEINEKYYKISLNRLNGVLTNNQTSFDTNKSKIENLETKTDNSELLEV